MHRILESAMERLHRGGGRYRPRLISVLWQTVHDLNDVMVVDEWNSGLCSEQSRWQAIYS